MLDFTSIKRNIKNDDTAMDLFVAAGHDKAVWKDLFNNMDIWWDTVQLSAKSIVESNVGVSLSNALAKKITKFWMMEKVKEL